MRFILFVFVQSDMISLLCSVKRNKVTLYDFRFFERTKVSLYNCV